MTEDPAPAVRAYIGLGANLGDPGRTLQAAVAAIGALPDTRLIAQSTCYRTAPIDAGGPDYLNAVVGIDTRLPAERLLAALQAIERAHGRQRPYRHAPRTLDLDLLLYGAQMVRSERLTLPHPRLHQRAFVLVPLAEIAPGLQIPGLGPIEALLPAVQSQRIERVAAP